MHSFCPVGDAVVTLYAEGIYEIGVSDEGWAVYDTREGELELINKVGDAVGVGVRLDGKVVGTLEVNIDGFNDGINGGVLIITVGFLDGAIELDGTVVGNLVGLNDGIREGIQLTTIGFVDGGIEYDGTIVGNLVGSNEGISEGV